MTPVEVRDKLAAILSLDETIVPRRAIVDMIQNGQIRSLQGCVDLGRQSDVMRLQLLLLQLARNCEDVLCDARNARYDELLAKCRVLFESLFATSLQS